MVFYHHLEERSFISFKINVIFIGQGTHSLSHPGIQIFSSMSSVILNPDRGVIDAAEFLWFCSQSIKIEGLFLIMAEILEKLRLNFFQIFSTPEHYKIKQHLKLPQDELFHFNIPFHSNTAKFSAINLPRNIIYFAICTCFNIPSQAQVLTAQPRNKYCVFDLPDK